ncbi:MAG: 23S rRNA (adenine(2503)-C(2))-methyltransferase RlmN [Chitinophagales bacterium]|jgi:23S rRNA (adenine2503-C2)-methyltransferase|nr:23S rRNA (adenine(2503)-C(2))-methyltransferase RlmN [Chitinophagales bacterium]
MSNKADIRTFSPEELTEEIIKLGEPKFRARQMHEWLWKKSARSFDEMTNLSKEFRTKLTEHFILSPVTENIVQKSKDGTVKLGMLLPDNRLIEGVMIPDEDRSTACVSSQVGCSLSCSFCATGFLKRERNLEAGEIYDQVVLLNKYALEHNGKPLTNIVYMGMGEPLLNYDNVMKSIRLITSPDGLNMAQKRITVSTSGIARGIARMADEGMKFNMALSLHAATNEKRNTIMDINQSNKIEEVMAALKYFYSKTGNKVTFEYILFNNFNDGLDDAENLLKLYQQVPAFINIIEYNNVEGVDLKKAKSETRDAFVNYLRNKGVDVAVRRSRGKDIDAACGQLANKNGK